MLNATTHYPNHYKCEMSLRVLSKLNFVSLTSATWFFLKFLFAKKGMKMLFGDSKNTDLHLDNHYLIISTSGRQFILIDSSISWCFLKITVYFLQVGPRAIEIC